MKTFRDAVHGDIRIFQHELIVINTKTYQRLHGIRQLDLAHKIYQDAVHTRFEHLIGATHLADAIWQTLCQRPHLKIWARDFAPDYQAKIDEVVRTAGLEAFRAVKLPEESLEITRHIVRLATLLHDITHIPFGHMLENQLALFRPHDAGHRLSWFLGNIVLELFGRFTQLRQEADPYYGPKNVCYLLFLLPQVARVLRELSKFAEPGDDSGESQEHAKAEFPQLELPNGLTPEFLWAIERLKQTDRLGPSELFIADIIGNTICADLLDYVRRDNYFTGLWDKYDDRIFRAFSLARVEEADEEPKNQQIRLAIQVIKGKFRHDTISNILRILELRYDLAEKVIFHHARCAASAMLARAFCFSGLDRNDEYLFYELGDDEAVRYVEHLASERKESSTVDVQAVGRLLGALRGRDFYKPYYRFLRGANEATRSGDVNEPTVGERLFAEFRKLAIPLLYQVEERAGLPHGSLVLYCPDPKMMLKETASIVCGDSDDSIPVGETLKEFVSKRMPVRLRQVDALEDRYAELWAATFYVHPEYRGRALLLKEITARLVEERFGTAPTPDPILEDELAKLPTAREIEARIKAVQEIEVGVYGDMVAAPSKARSQEALSEEVLKEDVFTRISSAIAHQQGRVSKETEQQEGKAGTLPGRASRPKASPDPKQETKLQPEDAKQLKLKGRDNGPDRASDK